MTAEANGATDEKRAEVARQIVARQDPNPRLTRMYRDWQQAEQRKQMAQQTLEGATAEALVREAKFKGAVDFIGGPGATWEYSVEHERVLVTEGPPEREPIKPKTDGRQVVLNGKMSARQMKAVMGAQAPHRKHRKG